MLTALMISAVFLAGVAGGILLYQAYQKAKRWARRFWEAMDYSSASAIALLIATSIAVLIVAAPACAQIYRTRCEYGGFCYRYRYDRWTHDWYRVHRLYYHPRAVYREEEREHFRYRDEHDDRDCRRGDVIDALSDQHKTEHEARRDAIGKWSAKIQWSHGGGEYMNFDLAADISWRCGPSDPGDTWLGGISKYTAKVTSDLPGASRDRDPEGRSIRCQVWAVPCKGDRERDGSGRR